jgi:hypothetical protein
MVLNPFVLLPWPVYRRGRPNPKKLRAVPRRTLRAEKVDPDPRDILNTFIQAIGYKKGYLIAFIRNLALSLSANIVLALDLEVWNSYNRDGDL